MVAEPETVVLDDDARTIVDRTPPARFDRVRTQVSEDTPRRFRFPTMRLRVLATALAFGGMAGWVYAERQQVHELREAYQVSTRTVTAQPPKPNEGVRPEPHVDAAAPEAEFPGEAAVEPSSAADLIIQNRLEEALQVYRRLAVTRASEPVYRDVLRVLETKLACGGNDTESGSRCDI